MIVSNISIIIAGDHHWDDQEQEYHECQIVQLRHHFTIWLERSGFSAVGLVTINLAYHPDIQKLEFLKASNRKVEAYLQEDTAFRNRYFISASTSSPSGDE